MDYTTQPPTVAQLFRFTRDRVPNQPALGTIVGGQLEWLTWRQIDDSVRRLANSLWHAGIRPGDRVVQIAENRREWIVLDLALHRISGVHVPLHVSLSAAQLAEQIRSSDSKLVFLSAQGFARFDDSFSWPCSAVCYDALAEIQSHIVLFDQFCSETPLADVEIPEAEPHSIATILYTSGTTGHSRGVMLSHANLATNAVAVSDAVGTDATETRLGILPLSHIYARTCDLYSWIYRGTRLVLAESRETLLRDCLLARPTAINAVPYFYQKIAQSARDVEPGAAQRLLGGEIQRCYCGGAAVAPAVEAWFEVQNLPLLSGYGLTEAGPVVSATSLENYRAGTVGKPLPNVEVKLSDEGEILVRGPNVMLGYWRDEQATSVAFSERWLRTGDLGSFDSSGHLRVTGRQKELIVLSTGKKVAPVAIEQCLLGSPLVEQVCVVGEGGARLAAIVVPCRDALRAAIRKRKLWVWSRRGALRHPRVLEIYRQEFNRLQSGCSREEQVGPIVLVGRAFSQELGEVTPKLSLRRAEIAANFHSELSRAYHQFVRKSTSAEKN